MQPPGCPYSDAVRCKRRAWTFTIESVDAESAQYAHVADLLHNSQAEFLELVSGLNDAQWSYRETPEAWSIGEIAQHLVLGEAALFRGAERALAAPADPQSEIKTAGKDEFLEKAIPKRGRKVQAPESIRPHHAWTREETIARFKERRALTLQFVAETDRPLAAHTFEHPFPVFNTLNAYQWLLYIPLHNMRHNQQIAEVKSSPGFPTRSLEGTIVQVNISLGGVPKRPIPAAAITPLGLAGDVFAHPEIHGGARQAVLIITAESIEELKARGYPVFPGALGENLTTRGLDRRQLRIGQQLRAGSAWLEITKVRGPCSALDVYGPSIKQEIYDASIKAGDTDSPRWGLSGFYARVLRPGEVRPEDIISVETMFV